MDQKLIKEYKKQGLKYFIYLKLRRIIFPYDKLLHYIPKKGRIVELGCGYGLLSLVIANKKSRKIIGVDLASNRLKIADKIRKSMNINNVRFIVCDVNKLKIKNKFDCVIIIDLLHHLSFKEQKKLISKCVRLLNQNGLLIIKELDSSKRFGYYFNIIHDFLMTGYIVNMQSQQTYRNILNENNFTTKIIKIKSFLPYPHILLIGKMKNEKKEYYSRAN